MSDFMHQQLEMMDECTPLMAKHDKRLEAVGKAVSGLKDHEAMTLACILENTEKVLDRYASRKSLSDATYSEVVGPFKRHAMNIVSAVYSTFDLKDIVSIQPLSQKIGALYFLNYKYANSKGALEAGTVMSAPDSQPTYDPYYASKWVKAESVTAAHDTANGSSSNTPGYEGILTYFPLLAGADDLAEMSIEVVGGLLAGTYEYSSADSTFNSSGGVTMIGLKSGSIVIYVETATGKFNYDDPNTAATNHICNYSWNAEKSGRWSQNIIPKVTISVDESLVTAERRQMMFDVSLDATYDYENQFGRNLNAELESSIIREIQNELGFYVLARLKEGATGHGNSTFTFDADRMAPSTTLAPAQSEYEHSQVLFKMLEKMSDKLYLNLGRGKGNFIVAGSDFTTYCSFLSGNGDVFKPVPVSTVRGPHKLGKLLGKYDVYYNPAYTAGEFYMGYKGSDWWEAPYFIGSYLPMMASKFMMFPDMHGEQGFVSMEAHKYLFPQHVVKGTITNV
jgi:hypothetical protein